MNIRVFVGIFLFVWFKTAVIKQNDKSKILKIATFCHFYFIFHLNDDIKNKLNVLLAHNHALAEPEIIIA